MTLRQLAVAALATTLLAGTSLAGPIAPRPIRAAPVKIHSRVASSGIMLPQSFTKAVQTPAFKIPKPAVGKVTPRPAFTAKSNRGLGTSIASARTVFNQSQPGLPGRAAYKIPARLVRK